MDPKICLSRFEVRQGSQFRNCQLPQIDPYSETLFYASNIKSRSL